MDVVRRSKNRGFVQVNHQVVRNQTFPRKIVSCTWWNFKGVIYCEMRTLGETVNSERYHEQMIRLSDAIKVKRFLSGSVMRQVMLLHNNVRPHTEKAISSLSWGFCRLCAFRMLPFWVATVSPIRFALYISRGSRESIDEYFESKPRSVRSGIQNLPEKWQKCVESEGEYFED